MTQKLQEQVLFKDGDWVKYRGQTYKVSLAFNPSANEVTYILQSHNSCAFSLSQVEAAKSLTKA